ncbi:hypothetical protein [Deinococcus soli (ex Cha et al. 2016)]|uniref:Uncharacterized protein n=2 Tax=Deinococcus soli (ex Cha et al. 2016) TaxID=1309411 RepID=A0ACC6KG77_9DEIO|nr:hypothetical protein [Deinococcus soli (ex Cha et al. 2016)]MDR6218478.1 hypothetical protein [Deinococcus soli (ex Cha et al. 2016)]MDR6329218.1 hypothetical protein [Deinococcus soli (ex Cha et al. 2016)]MDR6751491.1 hypothetical protein [Deinococcus soli (ex Cha et al. 2016)]
MTFWARWGPAVTAAALLAALCTWQAMQTLSLGGGAFTYALEDAYVHMQMALNLAQHGVWGVNPDAFSGSTSSPAWTVLLSAAYAVLGPHDLLPLALGGLLAAAFLTLADAVLLTLGVRRAGVRAGVLCGLVLLAPLPFMVLSGMETTLQVTAFTAVLLITARHVQGARVSPAWFAALAALTVGARYEMIAPLGILALAFAWRRQWLIAAALLVGAALPVALLGIVSMHHVGLALPNSVTSRLQDTDAPLAERLTRGWFLLTWAVSLAGAAALHARSAARRPALLLLAVMTAVSLAAHVLSGIPGFTYWAFRYDTYLIVAGTLLLPALLQDRPAVMVVAALLPLAGYLPTAHRRLAEPLYAPYVAQSFRVQQGTAARFLRAHYAGQDVLVDDLGYIGRYATVNLDDYAGLATTGLTAKTAQERFKFLRANAEKYQVVVLHTDMGRMPEWTLLGLWHSHTAMKVYSPVFAVYAPNRRAVPTLKRALCSAAPYRDERVTLELTFTCPAR